VRAPQQLIVPDIVVIAVLPVQQTTVQQQVAILPASPDHLIIWKTIVVKGFAMMVTTNTVTPVR